MPREAFEVIIGIPANTGSREIAIAQAAGYLAYADQTNTFGQYAGLLDVGTYGGGNQDWGVSIQFTVPIENDDAREQFMTEMENLSHVETYEQLAFEPA